jgi:hypothetical protein
MVRQLDESLLHSVGKTVAAQRSEALLATEAAAVSAFADRLDVVGKMRFGKEDQQTGLTPSEAAKLLQDLEDARQRKEKLQEQMERAEAQARGCVKEMQRLQGALAVAAADRETLLQTLLAARRELARRDVELERERAAVHALTQAKREEEAAAEAIAERARAAASAAAAAAAAAGQAPPPPDEAAAARSRLLLLQSLLEHERRMVREAREELHRDQALRTEAECVLRAAIADAKRGVAAARAEALAGAARRGASKAALALPGGHSRGSSGADALLPAPSRAAVLEGLLSQEAILNGLVSVVFPQGHARTLESLVQAGKEAAAGGGGSSSSSGKHQ